MEIQYLERSSGKVLTEKVYGEAAVRWLYEGILGKGVRSVLVRAWLSQLYGYLQDLPWSQNKVEPFIKKFQIPIEDYLPEDGRSQRSPYSTFNQFFIRRFKKGKRPYPQEAFILGAPCEARYFVYNENLSDQTYPVKGQFLTALELMGGNKKLAKDFKNGPIAIARLCPVDYHRFHFPDEGIVQDSFRVPGILDSVNPLALKHYPRVFVDNERHVTILKSKNFGKIALIEVGAICVGKIVQSYQEQQVLRGQEKGYFLFGGSSLVMLGEKGAFSFDGDLVKSTQEGREVLIKLGDGIARTK